MEGQKHSYQPKMNLLNRDNFKIYFLYVIFGFGGLWHLLGMFQNVMRSLASPLIILTSLLLVCIVSRSLSRQSKVPFLLWCSLIIFGGWLAEYIGIRTHFPFGRYIYGEVLRPQILDVPIAIGFAWLAICLSSLTIALRIFGYFQLKRSYSIYLISVGTALLMIVFDIVMENAASKLDYWIWSDGTVPIQNYLSWFVLGFGFSYLWLMLNRSEKPDTKFGLHVYLSQLLYFLLVLFK